MTFSEIIKQIVDKITDGVSINDNLSQLPLVILNKDQCDTLFSHFVTCSYNNKNIVAIKSVITGFEDARCNIDYLPVLINMFLNPYLAGEHIEYIISCYPERTALDYYIDIINLSNDAQSLKLAEIFTNYFPDFNDWNKLILLTEDVEEEEYENVQLRTYFQKKMTENEDKIPPWINKNLVKKEFDIDLSTIPSVKEASELLIEDFIKQKVSVGTNDNSEILKNLIISQYAISTSTEKLQLLKHIKNIPIVDDTLIFQEYGPVNTCYISNNNSYDKDHKCIKYGGCRMLLCNEFEQLNKYGSDIDIMSNYNDDWFRGYCDECSNKIGKKHYAIRLPLDHGGWKGCYCSFNCMKQEINNECVAIMTGRMKEQLDIFGIRDR